MRFLFWHHKHVRMFFQSAGIQVVAPFWAPIIKKLGNIYTLTPAIGCASLRCFSKIAKRLFTFFLISNSLIIICRPARPSVCLSVASSISSAMASARVTSSSGGTKSRFYDLQSFLVCLKRWLKSQAFPLPWLPSSELGIPSIS